MEEGKKRPSCVFCKRSHLSCDQERPCNRCVKRGIGNMCRDAPRTVRKRSKYWEDGGSSSSLDPKDFQLDHNRGSPLDLEAEQRIKGEGGGDKLRPSQYIEEQQKLTTTGVANDDAGQFLDFSSNILPVSSFHEFSDLTDFLDLMSAQTAASHQSLGISTYPNSHPPTNASDEGDVKRNSRRNKLVVHNDDPNPNAFATAQEGNAATPILQSSNILPLEPLSTAERYFLTASSSNKTSDEILDEVIRTKYEAGYIKPYNYAMGYFKLNNFIKSYCPESQLCITNVWDSFKPNFSVLIQNATELDLLFVEESFERLLLDYDRIFACIGVPSCLFRREGAIFKASREFASLINIPVEKLRDGRYGIYEFMNEDSVVNYWEKFGAVALDPNQKAVLTSCTLVNPITGIQRNCCFSFTLRRDKFNVPFCIIGHFIPIENEQEYGDDNDDDDDDSRRL